MDASRGASRRGTVVEGRTIMANRFKVGDHVRWNSEAGQGYNQPSLNPALRKPSTM